MKPTLILCEKPDVMRKISKALSQGNYREVRKYGASYCEFELDGRKYLAASSVGHLFTLDTEGSGWGYPIFDLTWRPSYLKRGTEYTRKYFQNLAMISKSCGEVIAACDYDVEGEVIAWTVLKFILKRGGAKRMVFSTLTDDEIRASFSRPRSSLNAGMVEAGLARHYLDALFGFNITRALTIARRRVDRYAKGVVSSGRVQSPCLALLLERELAIRKFIPTPYWLLELHAMKDGQEVVALHERGRFWDRGECVGILQKCHGWPAVAANISSRNIRTRAPYPFNTSALQSEAFSRFSFRPDRALAIAEDLYRRGHISYPRSASEKLPPTIGYKKIVGALAAIPQYASFANRLLESNHLRPHEGPSTDPAHPAVYATHEIPREFSSWEHQRFYDLVARRTLATFGSDLVRRSTDITLSVEDERFLANGIVTIEIGWAEIYIPYVELEEVRLPELKVGDLLTVDRIDMLEKFTEPPKRYTQGGIVREMERRNLGTKATRAQILKTLYDRGYIAGKSIAVTPLGEQVVNVLKEHANLLASEQLTRDFEGKMEEIMEGRNTRKRVVEEAMAILSRVLENMRADEQRIGRRLVGHEERVLKNGGEKSPAIN